MLRDGAVAVRCGYSRVFSKRCHTVRYQTEPHRMKIKNVQSCRAAQALHPHATIAMGHGDKHRPMRNPLHRVSI